MKIIPAIDIIGGKCVRLTQGDYGKMKVYRENPVEVAKEFEAADLEYLHLVDLDGAKKGKVVNWEVIESIQKPRHLAFEEGPLAAWLFRNLKDDVERTTVCDPRKNAWIAKGGDKSLP